eukprot:NODE_6487_length_530_cov_29.712159_g6322_i0.p1 GENE.NODE_6487_length_530_cov_29.712159_g6322_i0~~NODE_6487_length_530_cov_29.712159_g6322_i0.p1  ORF type:complete len:144 (-),score=10.87 NODE_6487_length_530_cov_29.712159_g6322_i0:99-488(-)
MISLRDLQSMSFEEARQLIQPRVGPPPVLRGNPDPLTRARTGSDYEELLRLDDNVVNRGVSEADNRRFVRQRQATIQHTKMDCSICQEGYRTGVDISYLPCEHIFHAECIDKWFQTHRRCPVCREEIGS